VAGVEIGWADFPSQVQANNSTPSINSTLSLHSTLSVDRTRAGAIYSLDRALCSQIYRQRTSIVPRDVAALAGIGVGWAV